MSRRALRNAAHWSLADSSGAAPPHAADVQATLEDPALAEALEQAASFGRLSDGDIRAMRAARRRNVITLGAVALVSAIGTGTWSSGWFKAGSAAPVVAHYETQRGQQQDVKLADGSTLHLSGATSLDVTLDDRERMVALERGEAYFDVAHESKRPFVVHAGDSATRVLGTAFDVDVARGEVKLSVYRGRVRFGSASYEAGSVDVPAGFRSRFRDGVARTPTRFDATQQDWRQDWVDTDDMRLVDLVDALNRRGGPMVMDPPPGLARITLSGRFKLDNSRQLLDAIGAAYGFNVVKEGDRLKLVVQTD
jgi:transmembrane sensor